MPDGGPTPNEVLARSGLMGAITGVILLLVALGNVVDVVSGRQYFKEDLAKYAINCLAGKGIFVDSVQSKKYKRLLKKIENFADTSSSGTQAKANYVGILKFVEQSLLITMPAGWEGVCERRLNGQKNKIKRAIESRLKNVSQWGDGEKCKVIEDVYNLSKVSFVAWFCSDKKRSAEWLGDWFKIRVALGLAGGFLESAGTGGTLGLFIGLVASLFKNKGDTIGWQVSIFPVIGTILGGYIRGVCMLVRYRYTSSSKRIECYWKYLMSIFAFWVVLSIVFAGSSAHYLRMVAVISPLPFFEIFR